MRDNKPTLSAIFSGKEATGDQSEARLRAEVLGAMAADVDGHFENVHYVSFRVDPEMVLAEQPANSYDNATDMQAYRQAKTIGASTIESVDEPAPAAASVTTTISSGNSHLEVSRANVASAYAEQESRASAA